MSPARTQSWVQLTRSSGVVFRRDSLDSRPGNPIPLGERPPDRPMAEALGNGRNYSRQTEEAAKWQSGSRTSDTYGREAFKLDRSKWRDSIPGVRRLSWELE